MESLDDIVYPVHTWDASKLYQDIYYIYLRSHGTLDADKIHDALWKLFHIGEWRKLGGRLKYEHGKLENHVPREFTTKRRAFNFAQQLYDYPIVDHSSAGALPCASDGLSIKSLPTGLKELGCGPGFPETMADLLNQDLPYMSFKIVAFSDASILTTSFPHTVFDAFGYMALINMLQKVLECHEDQVIPILGARNDVLAEIASDHKDHRQQEHITSNGTDTVPLHQPSANRLPPLERRIICLPRTAIEQIRDRELIRDDTGRDDKDYGLFRNDELCLAWAFQQIARSEPQPRPIAIANILNARFIFPRLLKAKGVYAQNMVLLAPNLLSAETAAGPLSSTIDAQRNCLDEHSRPQSAGNILNSWADTFQEKASALLIGDGVPVLVNNMDRLFSKFQVDLSPAVIYQDGNMSQSRLAGRPDFIYVTRHNVTQVTRSLYLSSTIGGGGDVYWLSGGLPTRTWELMIEDLEDL